MYVVYIQEIHGQKHLSDQKCTLIYNRGRQEFMLKVRQSIVSASQATDNLCCLFCVFLLQRLK